MKKLLPILFLSLAVLWACDEVNIAVNDNIRDFIEQKYEGAKILYAEKEFNGEIDVEIIHNDTRKDVKFNRREEWISTTWDVPVSQLPDVVRERVQDSYPEYRIDDADYIETPAGDRYKLEIERGEWDRTIFVTPDGIILN